MAHRKWAKGFMIFAGVLTALLPAILVFLSPDAPPYMFGGLLMIWCGVRA